MSTPRFTPEFKQEAVRQIVERGHSVADVSARIGVSEEQRGRSNFPFEFVPCEL
jgi:transposase-like protein